MWWRVQPAGSVVVGFIALAGVAAGIGVVMLIYLNRALDEARPRQAEGRALTRQDLYDAIMEGAVSGAPKIVSPPSGRPAADHGARARARDHAAHRGADDRRHDLSTY
jgi:hypothetical protein